MIPSMKYDSQKASLSLKFSRSKKGSVEEGINILMGLFIFVLVSAFIVYFMTSYINRMEEQSFLDSVTELQYAMDYACATGTETTVEVKMPQKVSNAVNWIAAYGDPQYVVYFERFPVGEEWAWTTLRPVNLGWLLAENLVIYGIATAVIPAGIGKVGNYFDDAAEGGYLYRLAMKLTGGNSRLSKEIIESSYELGADVQVTGASFKADAVVGSTIAQKKSVLGMVDDAIKKLRNFFTGKGEISEEAVKKIAMTYKSEAYLGSVGNKLKNLQTAVKGSQTVSDETLNAIRMSKGTMEDPVKAQKLIDYIDSNNGKFGSLDAEVQDFKAALDNNRRFITGDPSAMPEGMNPDDVKQFFTAFQQFSKGFQYKQLARNIILPAAVGKGTWAGNTYIFDSLLSPLDRANQKFSTCGAKALCAKTPNYIAVYPLTKCENNGIEYVRLDVKYSSHDSYWTDLLPTSPAWLTYLMGSNKRFYLASPCGETFKIVKSKCECHVALEPVFKFNWVEDENGEGNFIQEPAGVMRICDEPIGNSDGAFTTSDGKRGIESVDCLVVSAVSPIEGYGSGKSYENFCYSMPENMEKLSEQGTIALSVLVDIGITYYTAGTGQFLLGIVNNVFFTATQSYVMESYLWPKGGGT